MKLQCDKLPSNFAFNFNLRPSKMELALKKLAQNVKKHEESLRTAAVTMEVGTALNRLVIEGHDKRMVGRCSLTPA